MSWYNTARAHSSLDDATPGEHYFTHLPAPAMAA
jgi:transposase InsO family protein